MRSKKVLISCLAIVMILVMVFPMAACDEGSANKKTQSKPANTGSNDVYENYPYTITDSRGEKVTIEEEPKRVVSMAPNITEIVFAIGKGSSLVGRTDYCNYPEEAATVEAIGDIMTPNVEKIVAQEPDLVLISGTTMPDSLGVLKDLGTKFIVINEQSDFNDVYETIETIGRVLNAKDKASEIVAGMKTDVEKVVNLVKDKPTPKTYYVMGYGESGEYTATGDTFLGKMITMAGGDNIAKDATGWKFNLEDIVSANPEVLLLSEMNGTIDNPNAALQEANGYKDLTVVKENKVQFVNDDLVLRPGPRIAKGLEDLARKIHPELFQ